jgi:peptidoglycan/LPS O-acetylase OafA/YrhL
VNPEPVVNGSLWSLGVEFCCYLMLVASALLGVRARVMIRWVPVAGIGSVVLAGVLVGPMRTTAIAVVFFLIGSLAAKGGKLAQWPLWPALVGLVLIVPLQGWLGTLLAWPVVAYAVVAIGSRRSRIAGMVRNAGDPSYGMYLWGFLIQQLLVRSFEPLPLLANVAVVLVLSAGAGYASWHLVEKHAIALGGRLSVRAERSSMPVPRPAT